MNKHNILILGGYSNKNIPWIKEMKEQYSINYNTKIIEYNHWYNNKELNIEQEINKIKNILNTENIDTIIAKSIGIYLVSESLKDNDNLPKNIIFMGYPLKVLTEDKIDISKDIINLNNKTNILLIQQENDFLATPEEVNQILNNKINIKVIKGSDHSYSDLDLIKEHIDTFINNIIN